MNAIHTRTTIHEAIAPAFRLPKDPKRSGRRQSPNRVINGHIRKALEHASLIEQTPYKLRGQDLEEIA